MRTETKNIFIKIYNGKYYIKSDSHFVWEIIAMGVVTEDTGFFPI